jgi:hypothetical protein
MFKISPNNVANITPRHIILFFENKETALHLFLCTNIHNFADKNEKN